MHLPSLALVLLAGHISTVEPMTLPGFRAELERASATFSIDLTIDEARVAAAALPDAWRVEDDNGAVIAVDARWIDAEVHAGDASNWPSRRDAIRRRLATLRAEAVAGAAAQDPGPVLAAILARPEFRRSPASLWWETQRNRAAQWIRRMFSRMIGAPVRRRTVALAVAWLISLAALLALVLWLITMLTRRSRAATLELGGSVPPRTPARTWARRALAALRAGDTREGVRCGYHAALCRLEEQGIWNVDESRTPREYLHLLQPDDPQRGPVAVLTRQFEDVWYGRQPATSEDAMRLSDNLERLGCLRAADRAN